MDAETAHRHLLGSLTSDQLKSRHIVPAALPLPPGDVREHHRRHIEVRNAARQARDLAVKNLDETRRQLASAEGRVKDLEAAEGRIITHMKANGADAPLPADLRDVDGQLPAAKQKRDRLSIIVGHCEAGVKAAEEAIRAPQRDVQTSALTIMGDYAKTLVAEYLKLHKQLEAMRERIAHAANFQVIDVAWDCEDGRKDVATPWNLRQRRTSAGMEAGFIKDGRVPPQMPHGYGLECTKAWMDLYARLLEDPEAEADELRERVFVDGKEIKF